MEQIYDMIIIGGGPAGYTAALYAARAGLSTLVLEKLSAGGQMALTEQIDNYPGFESGIDGFTLGEKMQQSAERFGAVTELAEVYKVSLSGRIKTLDTSEGVFQSRTVVIATGASPRPLGIPGEDTLTGKGVHYCAACDGAPYRGKTVAVVGGGNSAAADALALSRIAKKVYLIHRRDSLRATKVYHEPLMAAPNVEFCWNSTVSALLHENCLTGLRLQDVNTGAERDLACDGVFISVGRARRRSCSGMNWRWTSPAISSRTNPPARIFPACSLWATCAPRRCGRWSPPYRTARWPSTMQRNIWRRIGKGAANDPLIDSSCPQATRLRAMPHRGAG